MTSRIPPRELDALVQTLKSFDPNVLADEVIRVGEQWADNDAAASALEETKKTMLARLTLEYLEGHSKSGGLGEKPRPMPVSQAELRALCDGRYEQHIDLMVAARKEAQIYRVRYDLGRMRLELMRSLQATLRNEMRISGYQT
jgi:hypothetical protein